jgi:hypothetical protein
MKQRRLVTALVALVAVLSSPARTSAYFYGDGLQPMQFAQPPQAVGGWPLQQQQLYGGAAGMRFREMETPMLPAVIQDPHAPTAGTLNEAVTEDEVFACANGACDQTNEMPVAPLSVGLPQPEQLTEPQMVAPSVVEQEGGDPATGASDGDQLCDETGECVLAETPADGFAREDSTDVAKFAKKVEDLTFGIRKKAKNVLEAEEWVKQVEEILTRYTDKVRRVKKHVSKEREAIRTLLKEKKRVKDEQKRQELEDKLKQASEQLTGLKDALTEVKDKRDDFVDTKQSLELKVASLKHMLGRLKGDDDTDTMMSDVNKLVDQEALKEVIEGKDQQAIDESNAEAIAGSDEDAEKEAAEKVAEAEAEGQKQGEEAAEAQQEEEAAAEEEQAAAAF